MDSTSTPHRSCDARSPRGARPARLSLASAAVLLCSNLLLLAGTGIALLVASIILIPGGAPVPGETPPNTQGAGAVLLGWGIACLLMMVVGSDLVIRRRLSPLRTSLVGLAMMALAAVMWIVALLIASVVR